MKGWQRQKRKGDKNCVIQRRSNGRLIENGGGNYLFFEVDSGLARGSYNPDYMSHE